MAKIISLKKQKYLPKWKYGINKQVDSLPRTITIRHLLAHLEDYGISRNEFYADRNIPFGSDKSIPADRLMIYLRVFDCAFADLINLPPAAKSIREEMRHKTKSPLA